MRKSNPGKAYSGMGRLTFENGKALIGQTLKGTPAYVAGLDAGATLLTIDGTEIKDQATLNKVTEAHQPGDIVKITYSYYGEVKNTLLTFSENPALELIAIEKTGGKLTPEMQAFRTAWLGSKVKTP
ncbi:PDZ domain protein [compost metagenome]